MEITASHVDQLSPPEAELVAKSPSTGDDNFIIRTCSGIGCAFNRHFKQCTRVNANATTANNKKNVRNALHKVLEIEEQLSIPMDDIFHLLHGISLLLT